MRRGCWWLLLFLVPVIPQVQSVTRFQSNDSSLLISTLVSLRARHTTQGASPAAILEGQQWRSSLAASSSVTSTAAPAAAVLPPPPTAAQRSTTWPAKPQAIGDWLQPDSPSAVTPPRPPHGSSSNSMVFPTAAYDEERASAGGVGTPTVSVSRVKTAVATLAAVVSALCGSPAAVSSPTYDTVYDGVLAQSEQRASSRSAPSAAEVAVRQQATHSPAATSSSGPSSVAQPSGAAASAASARRRHQESVQARVAELAAQADEEHRLADGAGDEAIRRRHHAAAVKLAADIARLTKGLRQYGR